MLPQLCWCHCKAYTSQPFRWRPHLSTSVSPTPPPYCQLATCRPLLCSLVLTVVCSTCAVSSCCGRSFLSTLPRAHPTCTMPKLSTSMSFKRRCVACGQREDDAHSLALHYNCLTCIGASPLVPSVCASGSLTSCRATLARYCVLQLARASSTDLASSCELLASPRTT